MRAIGFPSFVVVGLLLFFLVAVPPYPVEGADRSSPSKVHWVWQPIADPEPPKVQNSAWPRDPIDRFILARLETAGLSPAPDASRRTWLRRVSLDLVGPPPAPEDIAAFTTDIAPGARQRAVRRLLASKHFGEHWGRSWLDLVRYAETRGHEGDFPIPHAYRYRDYVIRAFNADVPYDQLVIEHLAGDLIASPRLDPETRVNESIQGTGFWHLGEATHSPVDIRGDEAERVANQIEVFSKTFLGLNLGCARCHEHKFDPISQEDYYAIYGFLQSSSYQLADVADPPAQRQAFEKLTELRATSSQRIVSLYGAAVERGTDEIGQYLLAAREVIRGKGVKAVASEKNLVPAKVTLWQQYLDTARREITDPFHAFATLAVLEGNPDRDTIGAALNATRDAWRRLAEESEKKSSSQKVVSTVEDGERNYVRSERPVSGDDVVLDHERDEPWLTSGHRFGNDPGDIGEIILGTDAQHPIVKVSERAAARSDLTSSKLTGILRTRTFEVTSDTLWYRTTGSADVFLAVDSHRVVRGPLHGVVKLKIKGDGSPKWHAHNVRDYIGHRIHVEFTPAGEQFSLQKIQFCSGQPVQVFEPNAFLVATLDAEVPESMEELAAAHAWILASSVRQLGEGADRNRLMKRGAARVVNWMLEHRDLLPTDPENQKAMAALFRDYATRKAAIEKGIPGPVRALAMLDGTAEREPVHFRGNHHTMSEHLVPRRLLTSLDPANTSIGGPGSGRLELARKLTSPSNPLVSRVMVNRIWHRLFGRGIVATVDDFGLMGEEPSHPQLLDYMAREFIRDGWSIKRFIERLVLTRTYGMSSRPRPAAGEIDPKNILLHRRRVRRLEGETIRDSILAISGRLDRKMYGPSVKIHITPFMRGNRSPGGSGPADGDGRRSIYLEVRRNHLSHFLTAFDRPVPFTTIGRRSTSNSPAQPLMLLNDPFVHQQAELWARRLLEYEDRSVEQLIELAYLQAFARPPSATELEVSIMFLREQSGGDGEVRGTQAAWKEWCHTLMNVKEFIYIK